MNSSNESGGNPGDKMGEVYDEQAREFAEQAPSLNTWLYVGSRAIERHLGKFFGKEGVEILDLGSASGRVEKFLIKKGVPASHITGIEVSPVQVEIAQKEVPGPNYQVGDLRDVQLPHERFDAAVTHMVTEFIEPEGLEKMFKNVYEALKPGGTFLIVTTHPGKMKIYNKVTQKGWFKTTAPWGGPIENYYREIDDYIETLKKAGFAIDVVEDLEMPEEVKKVDPEDYERSKSFGPIRLAIEAHKTIEEAKR